mmetsp:Transcript_60312/g.166945  ORF Transcript_60312/g.166945 Transcript_60312/m.166945 type:complete len:708 (+) Transcript_60312:89-2212(+)
MPFDRAAAEALALEAARIFADGLGSFIAAAAAEAAAERCRLAEEARELSERREGLEEELRAIGEARARLAGEWQRLQRAGVQLPLGDAGAEVLGAQSENVRLAECLAAAEAEQQRGGAELEARNAALGLLRSELTAGAREEAVIVADLAQLRAELGRLEDEQSSMKTSVFQRSCELADFRRHSEADAEVKGSPPEATVAVSLTVPVAYSGASPSPRNAGSRGTPMRGGTAGHTPASRSSRHSTPKRLHLEEEAGFHGYPSRSVASRSSAASSPGNAQMALTRSRRDLAAAQQRHGRDSLEALRAAGDLALALEEAGEDHEEVGRLLRSVLTGLERQLGEDHLDTLRAANNMAVFLDNSGEAQEALLLYRRASRGRRQQLGKDHPHALDSTYNLALFLQNGGELVEAEDLFREVLAGCIKTFGARHHSSLDCMERLVEVLEQRGAGPDDHGRPEERVRLCRGLLEGREAVLGAGHTETLRAAVLLLEALSAEQGVASEAVVRAHCDVIRRHEQALGLNDPATLELTMDLAAALASRGEAQRAEEVLRRARAAAEQTCGPASPAALGYDDELAVLLANAGRLAEAEPLFRRALTARRKALGPWHEDTLRSEHNLAVLLDNCGQREEAGRAYREVLRGRSEVLGESHPKTIEATYNLAMFLAGGEGFREEAERLLVAAQRGLEAHFGHDDARRTACAKRLSELRLGRRNT